MRITKVVLENYKSFQLPTTIDFTKGVEDPQRNVFLIGGMNGAGKTSVLEAINICLYGVKRKQIYNAINRRELAKGNCSCALELHLRMDSGEDIAIKRSWAARPTLGTFAAEYLDDKLSVVRDDQRIYITAAETWEEWLSANIPKGVSQFFFFDGEKVQEMATEEGAERKLKASMEAVLGIEVVRRLIADLKHVQTRQRRSYTDISDEDIQLKENELDLLRRKTERAKGDRDAVERDIEEFEDELQQRREEFERLFGIEPEAVEERRRRESRRLQLSTRRAEIDKEIASFAEADLPLALAAEMFPQLRDQIEAEARVRDAEALNRLASDLTDEIVGKLFEPKSFCCGRVLGAEEVEEARDRVLGAARSVMAVGEGPKPTDIILGLSQAEEAQVVQRMAEIERFPGTQLRRLLEEREQISAELDELDRIPAISTLEGMDPDLFNQLQSEIEGYAQQLGRKRKELNRAQQSIVELEEEAEVKERDLNILYQKHEVAKELTAFLTVCDSLVDTFDAYLDELRRTKIKQLEALTYDMYRRLASKGDLIDSIRIDPATYLVTIQDRHGNEVRKANLSAGEKEVFAISLLWGLAQTSELRLPIVIDTPLARLDSTHRDAIVGNYLPNAGDQVIVLSTDTEVDQRYYRQLEPHLQYAVRLNFDKYREFSTVEEGYFWEEE